MKRRTFAASSITVLLLLAMIDTQAQDGPFTGQTDLQLTANSEITTSFAPGAACGPHIYVEKCKYCFLLQDRTSAEARDRCKEVARLIQHNKKVLESDLCRLSTYKGWREGADEKSKEALRDLIDQLTGLPGITEPLNTKSVAGKLSFAGRVVDLLKIQVSVIEFLGNSQGGSFFTGLIRGANRNVRSVSKELTKEATWYDRNCPPLDVDVPMEPMEPPEGGWPPDEETPVDDPADDITLDEHEDELFDQNALRWNLNFLEDAFTVATWNALLSDIPAFGVVGFVRGLNRGTYVGRLHPVNLTNARLALDHAFAKMPDGAEQRFLAEDFFEHTDGAFLDGLPPLEDRLSEERMGETAGPDVHDPDVPVHDQVRLMPGSVPVTDVRYELAGSERMTSAEEELTVSGARWYAEYEIRDASGARDVRFEPAHILTEYTLDADRLGGEILSRTKNRLEYRVPAANGRSSTWVKLWASSGYYTLTAVDER